MKLEVSRVSRLHGTLFLLRYMDGGYHQLYKVYLIKYSLSSILYGMNINLLSTSKIKALIKSGQRLPFATENYPSRGQTTVQELYQTTYGKLFLKKVSERNHDECQINIKSGTLAEREFWAYRLASAIGLFVPPLWLMDKFTTVQIWFDYPDGKTFKKSTGKMEFIVENIFDCVIFDWVTGQIDRHDANYLYNYKDKLVIPVDSAHSFLRFEGSLPDYLHLFEIGETKYLSKQIKSALKEKLTSMSDRVLQSLVPLRDSNEARALMDRKKVLSVVNTIQDVLNLFRRKI